MEKFSVKYFLAANSCDGFVSEFSNPYYRENKWKIYIIKGGAGCGKSTFMKNIAKSYLKSGHIPHLCPCSSDPNSLDAVILKDDNIIILDGTSPHIVEPLYPGVVENLLNFGEFWNVDKLAEKAQSVINFTDKNKELHKNASLYLTAAGKFLKENISIYKNVLLNDKLERFTENFSSKFFENDTDKCGREQLIFLSAITPSGIVNFENTVNSICDEIFPFKDDNGIITNMIFTNIKNKALSNGYDVITVKNALLPNLTDHILIPSLSLAFVRENKTIKFNTEKRRVNTTRFLNKKSIKNSLKKIRFNGKISENLIKTSIEILKEAKNVHDSLEKCYYEAMDFKRLSIFTDNFIKNTLKIKN